MVFWKRGAKGDDIRELPPPNSGGRPKLKAAFTQELQASVRNLADSNHDKAKGRFGFLGSGKMSPFRSAGRPRLSKEQQDELRLSVHNLMAKREKTESSKESIQSTLPDRRPENLRPTLNQNISDELTQSFRQREARNDARREEIRKRMIERRESKRQLESHVYPQVINEENESDSDSPGRSPKLAQHNVAPNLSGERPRLRPDLFDELKKSIHSRSTRNFDRRQEIKARLMKRRESQRNLPNPSTHSTSSDASFAEGHDSFATDLPPKSALRGKGGKVMKWDMSAHSSETFANASFSDMGDTEHGPNFKPSALDESISEQHDKEGVKVVGDLDRAEWSDLIRENKRLKCEDDLNKKKISILTQQVDGFRAESTDLRKQLSSWQEKASAISHRQSQDRQKFENSSDLMTKARVELTKALNENASLKSRLHEIQLQAESHDRTILFLNETIDNLSEKISSITAQLKDSEAELRFNINEKRRIEEELAVVIASGDGSDIGETIRRLEQDKAKWLEERERILEAKRIAIDEENDRLLEREKQRYRREAEQLVAVSEKTKDREGEHQRLQDAISGQLKELKKNNDDLREKVNNEQLENRVETRKKDHTIAMLEQELSKLRRKLAGSQLREQDFEAQLLDIQNSSDELRDAKRQISLLEKQIKKLKKEKAHERTDWKEIILPGYKHLRGVTFGAPSDELAGFLTILVEDQKAKQSEVMSQIQNDVKKFLKEAKDKVGSGMSSASRSKSNKDEKQAKPRKSNDANKTSTTRKRKMDPNEFTDIEDYDWAVKPKKTVTPIHRVQVEESSSSEDDSSTNHSLKKHRRRDKRRKQKKKSRAKKKEKPKLKKHGKIQPKQQPARRRISRHRPTLDDNIEMMERKSKNSVAMNLDDISLVVIKRTHANKLKKKKKRSSDPRRRLPPVKPPATIILQ